MPKKTSRAARTLQNQREVERKKVEAARPLIASSSALAATEVAPVEPDVSESEAVQEVPRRVTVTPPVPAPVAQDTIRPAAPSRTRGPLPNRRFSGTRQPPISREDEFAFVRADLRTVLILTVLMIIALVVLTIVIGR
jgi:hypothetical protein